MAATVHALPALTPQAPSPGLIPAAEILSAAGWTPLRVWRSDPHWPDPDLGDPNFLRLAEALAWVRGEPSPLETWLSSTGNAAVLAASVT